MRRVCLLDSDVGDFDGGRRAEGRLALLDIVRNEGDHCEPGATQLLVLADELVPSDAHQNRVAFKQII